VSNVLSEEKNSRSSRWDGWVGRCGALKEQRIFAGKPLEHICALRE